MKNEAYNMKELRRVFSRMFPDIDHNIHMNTIADMLLHMKLTPGRENFGVYLDYYQVKRIKEGCLHIKHKKKE